MVTDHTGTVRTFGPYELTVDIEDGGYPVTGNTESWWRPLDILVSDNGDVDVVPADTTALQDPP